MKARIRIQLLAEMGVGWRLRRPDQEEEDQLIHLKETTSGSR